VCFLSAVKAVVSVAEQEGGVRVCLSTAGRRRRVCRSWRRLWMLLGKRTCFLAVSINAPN